MDQNATSLTVFFHTKLCAVSISCMKANIYLTIRPFRGCASLIFWISSTFHIWGLHHYLPSLYLGNEGCGVCTVFKELNWYNCFAFMRVVGKGGARRRRESGGGLPLGGEAPARRNDERGIGGSAHSNGGRPKGARRGGVGNRSAQYWRAR